MRAMAYFFLGDRQSCFESAVRALARADDPRQGIKSVAHLYRGTVEVMDGRAADAEPDLEAGARLSERAGDYFAALSARMSLGAGSVQSGDLDLARHWFDSIDDLAASAARSDYGFPLVGAADIGRGVIDYERLRIDRAVDELRRVVHQLQTTGSVDYAIQGYCRLADAESLRGRHDEAAEVLADGRRYADDVGGTVPPILLQALAVCEARTALRRGDADAAAEAHRAAAALPASGRWVLIDPGFELGVVAARLLLTDGDPEPATIAVAELERRAGDDQGLLLEAAALRAEVAVASGDQPAAATLLADTLATAARQGWARPFVDSWPRLAPLAERQSGTVRDLVAAVGTAAAVAVPAARSGSTAAAQPGLVVPLTARELEVLGEVEAGHTNAEIADRLYISVGTIPSQLSHRGMAPVSRPASPHSSGVAPKVRALPMAKLASAVANGQLVSDEEGVGTPVAQIGCGGAEHGRLEHVEHVRREQDRKADDEGQTAEGRRRPAVEEVMVGDPQRQVEHAQGDTAEAVDDRAGRIVGQLLEVPDEVGPSVRRLDPGEEVSGDDRGQVGDRGDETGPSGPPHQPARRAVRRFVEGWVIGGGVDRPDRCEVGRRAAHHTAPFARRDRYESCPISFRTVRATTTTRTADPAARTQTGARRQRPAT